MHSDDAESAFYIVRGSMHYTLTPRGNAMLIVLMAALLFACFFTGHGPSLPILSGFAVAGVFAGFLQNIALRHHVNQFQSASSVVQVRAVLILSVPGKASVSILWIAAFALILLIVYDGGRYATLQTMLGSYAAFSLARETVAFPALFALRSE